MATFKIGQRVRIKASAAIKKSLAHLAGVETTIRGPSPDKWFDWELNIPAPSFDADYDFVQACSAALEPLTDPGADAFIERIKKLKPYDEPKVEPKRVPVIAPTAIYNGMTLACTPEGVFALRDGVWTKIEPR